MSMFYTGVGRRNTPKAIQLIQQQLAMDLEGRGYVLRSGGADGSDSAFERGVTVPDYKEIFISWSGFNGRTAGPGVIDATTLENYDQAIAIAKGVHPVWDKLTRGPRAHHTRNVYQVLGRDLATPSRFLLCWAEYQGNNRNVVKGGTNTALQLALRNGVPSLNLFGAPSYDAVIEKLMPYLD